MLGWGHGRSPPSFIRLSQLSGRHDGQTGARTPHTGLGGRGRRELGSDTGPEERFPAAPSWGRWRLSQAPRLLAALKDHSCYSWSARRKLVCRLRAGAAEGSCHGGARTLCRMLQAPGLSTGSVQSVATLFMQLRWQDSLPWQAGEPEHGSAPGRSLGAGTADFRAASRAPGLCRSPILTVPRRLASRGHGCRRPLRVLGSSSLTRDRRSCSHVPCALCLR